MVDLSVLIDVAESLHKLIVFAEVKLNSISAYLIEPLVHFIILFKEEVTASPGNRKADEVVIPTNNALVENAITSLRLNS